MNSFLLTAAAMLAVSVGQVQLKDGRTIDGRIIAANQDVVVVNVSGEEQSFGRDEIRNLIVTDEDQSISQRPAVRLQLRDNSIIHAKSILVTGGSAEVTAQKLKLKIPVAQIRYVRFGTEKEKDKRWDEILTRNPTADSIVVQGPDDLEALEGVLGDVSAPHVAFEFDGDVIDVKRQKVDGFVYYSAKKIDYPQAPCIVHTTNNSVIQAETLVMKDGASMSVKSQNGISFQLPFDAVRRIEYSDTNTVFLSDLDPESFSWRPAFSVGTPLPELQELYRPTRDVNFFGEPLSIQPNQVSSNRETFAKGISVQSQTRVTYRLAGEFRRLQALAGIDARLLPHGNVELKLIGDGNVLFSTQISGTSDAIGIDVDLVTIKRLTIEVNFGDNSNAGDHLNLCNARLSK